MVLHYVCRNAATQSLALIRTFTKPYIMWFECHTLTLLFFFTLKHTNNIEVFFLIPSFIKAALKLSRFFQIDFPKLLGFLWRFTILLHFPRTFFTMPKTIINPHAIASILAAYTRRVYVRHPYARNFRCVHRRGARATNPVWALNKQFSR